jgi:spore coat polysaccharide biosynthesis predicted glycosyltransferase SpsG
MKIKVELYSGNNGLKASKPKILITEEMCYHEDSAKWINSNCVSTVHTGRAAYLKITD